VRTAQNRTVLSQFHKYLLILLFVFLIVCTLQACSSFGHYSECDKYLDGPAVELEICNAEIREWRIGTDRENWDLCYNVMKEHHIVMVYKNYVGHIMPKNWNSNMPPFVVKELLAQNRCRQILGEYWADY